MKSKQIPKTRILSEKMHLVPCVGSGVKFASTFRLKMYQANQYFDLTEGAQEYDSALALQLIYF